MRQRVGMAQALLNDPQLLDEPTASLDPEERVRFRNLLSELSGERIVILSTYIFSDVEAVATDIAILAHGQLLAIHRNRYSQQSQEKSGKSLFPAPLCQLFNDHTLSTAHRGDGVPVRIVSDTPPRPQALEPRLEDAYLAAIAGQRTVPGRSGTTRPVRDILITRFFRLRGDECVRTPA